MSADRIDVLADWQVTYLNFLSGERCVLIDNVDEQTADAVVEKFGSCGDKFNQLPEVRKERAALARVGGEA